ncbi:hypothetical protein SNF32_05440 [Enterococcus mundtii]|nr:hypothetical protein [Enterococcus mundtii]
MNYQRGQALTDLKAISKSHYTPKLLSAIDYVRSLGAGVLRTVDVDKHVQTDRKLQQVAQLRAQGSFADRTNRAKKWREISNKIARQQVTMKKSLRIIVILQTKNKVASKKRTFKNVRFFYTKT